MQYELSSLAFGHLVSSPSAWMTKARVAVSPMYSEWVMTHICCPTVVSTSMPFHLEEQECQPELGKNQISSVGTSNIVSLCPGLFSYRLLTSASSILYPPSFPSAKTNDSSEHTQQLLAIISMSAALVSTFALLQLVLSIASKLLLNTSCPEPLMVWTSVRPAWPYDQDTLPHSLLLGTSLFPDCAKLHPCDLENSCSSARSLLQCQRVLLWPLSLKWWNAILLLLISFIFHHHFASFIALVIIWNLRWLFVFVLSFSPLNSLQLCFMPQIPWETLTME